MKEDVSRILKMVEEGKINSDKAAELIDALKGSKEIIPLQGTSTYQNRMLRVKILSTEGDKVNVNLPIKFISAILKSTRKIPGLAMKHADMDIDMDMEELMEAIEQAINCEMDGKIVDIQSAKGDLVEVVIE